MLRTPVRANRRRAGSPDTAARTAPGRGRGRSRAGPAGGTSKGAGDLSHTIVSRLGKPGILVHGVALKPGKPLCLAICNDKPLAVLPGFPTSAIFTFHAFVAPVIRRLAGLPPENPRIVEARGRTAQTVRHLAAKGFSEESLESLVAELSWDAID